MEGIGEVLVRWLHLGAVTTVAGGLLWTLLIEATWSRLARWWLASATMVAIGSGLYLLFASHHAPKGYHLWIGVKILFAAHTLAVSAKLAVSPAALVHAKRLLIGAAASAWIALLIAAYVHQMK